MFLFSNAVLKNHNKRTTIEKHALCILSISSNHLGFAQAHITLNTVIINVYLNNTIKYMRQDALVHSTNEFLYCCIIVNIFLLFVSIQSVIILLTKVTSRKNALHRMFCSVLVCCGTRLVTGSTQVVIDANQTFVSSSSKVIFQTRITADS